MAFYKFHISFFFFFFLSLFTNSNKGKLYFTTLNYALDYTLHPKLFECTVYTINYEILLHFAPDVSFTVKFNGNMKHVTCTCVLLKWHDLKDQKTLFPIN